MKAMMMLLAMLLLTATAAHAEAPAAPRAPASAPDASRETEIKFDSEVVEGMSRAGLDALGVFSVRAGSDQKALFKKKVNLRPEIDSSLKEAGHLK